MIDSIYEYIEKLSLEDLQALQKKIADVIAKKTSDYKEKLLAKVPGLQEYDDCIEFVVANGKWAFFECSVSRNLLYNTIVPLIRSSGIHCFARVNTDVYVNGRGYSFSRLLGVLKEDLE